MKREKVTETTRDSIVWPPLSCRAHLLAFVPVPGEGIGQGGGAVVVASSYEDLVRLLVNTSTLVYLVGVV